MLPGPGTVVDIEANSTEISLTALLTLFTERPGRARIQVESAQGQAQIFVEDGYVEWVHSNFPTHLLTGDVLCQIGSTTPDAVLKAFVAQLADSTSDPARLGSYLVRASQVNESDVADALTVQVAEDAVRSVLLEAAEYKVEVDASSRTPYRAHLPIIDILEVAQARGSAFNKFNAHLRLDVDETRIPPNARAALRSGKSLREAANILKAPEWALAQALESKTGPLHWQESDESAQNSISLNQMLATLQGARDAAQAVSARTVMLVRAERMDAALRYIERFYRTAGFFQLADPQAVAHALALQVEKHGKTEKFPLEQILRPANEGGYDISLARAVAVLLPPHLQENFEQRINEALKYTLGHIFSLCVLQVTALIDRDAARNNFEELKQWLDQ